MQYQEPFLIGNHIFWKHRKRVKIVHRTHQNFHTVNFIEQNILSDMQFTIHSSTPVLLEFSSEQVLTALLGINNNQNSSEFHSE